MPEPKQRQKSPPDTAPRPPSRAEVEAEVPRAPAYEPLAEPNPVDRTRGPHVQIEPEGE